VSAADPFDLRGRVALVTGAGSESGIGFAAARLLMQRGATVAVASTTDRIAVRADELGGRASGHVADLTDEGAVDRLLADVVDRYGAIDVLVNNAGMVSAGTASESGAVVGMSSRTWREGIARNLDSVFWVSRGVLPAMLERRWGRIVTVSSVTGPVMSMRGEAAYAAAKAGVVGLMRSIAVDYADAGVTANAVAPGWIATGSQTDAEAREGAVSPVRRSGTPDEVASAIVWLCTPGAAYVTGQCIVVDGGNSVAEERF
jgi:3-oxoacyl-[acyl-carrier protein] reductase